MNNAHALRHCLAIAQNNFAAGWSGCVGETFKFQARENVRQTSVAIVAYFTRVEQVIPRSKDDVANIHVHELILLVEIDRAGGAELLARFAGTFDEVSAVLFIHHWEFGNGLCEWRVNRFTISQPSFIDIVDHFLRALFLTDTAACA